MEDEIYISLKKIQNKTLIVHDEWFIEKKIYRIWCQLYISVKEIPRHINVNYDMIMW